MKYCSLFLLLSMIMAVPAYTQQITLPDGSPVPEQFCHNDTAVQIKGDVQGGTFSGCGVMQQNGLWYFNPARAVSEVTVFPHSCHIMYTSQHSSISKRIIIHKPVIIEPSLQSQGTCDGAFTLRAATKYAGSYRYSWAPALPLQEPGQAETKGLISQTTTFYLTVTDNISGCTGKDTVMISKYPIPVVTVSPEAIIIKAGESIPLEASGAVSYQWLPGKWLSSNTIPDPVAYPRAPVTYTVVGRNEFGCYDSAHARIAIIEDYFIPGAFTPNGDGLNDVFKIENIGYQGIGAFQIFNRWGELVFEGHTASAQWDGTCNGRDAPAGTYFYHIILNALDGSSKVHKGSVTLLR